MSRYYREEDIVDMIEQGFSLDTDGDKAYVVHELLPSLPTIKVDEDLISRRGLEQRVQVISYQNEWGETEINEYVCWEDVEDAPSVVSDFKTFCGVPIEEAIDVLERYTTEQSSKVGEPKEDKMVSALSDMIDDGWKIQF